MSFEPEEQNEPADHSAANRNDLHIAIAGVQATLEFTEEEDTRQRMKDVLRCLQRMEKQREERRKG